MSGGEGTAMQRAAEIPRQVERLKEVIEKAQEQMAQTHQRLDPVLRNEPTEERMEKEEPPPPATTSLGGVLREMIERVEGMQASMKSTLHRLEV